MVMPYGTEQKLKWKSSDASLTWIVTVTNQLVATGNLRWGGSYTDIKSYLLSWLLLDFRCQIQFPRKAGVNPLWYKTIQI